MRIVSRNEMSGADRYTINELGISGEILMESAAQAISEKIKTLFDKSQKLVVLAGTGNNGGDGIAITRRLCGAGYNVQLWLVPPEHSVRDAAKIHLEIYKRHGYQINDYSEKIYAAIAGADGIIDALLGIGIKGKPREPYDRIFQAVNASMATVISVDLPSGVNAELAQVEQAVQADMTYTIQWPKRSCFLYPAAAYYGKWEAVDIGIPPAALEDEAQYKQMWQEKDCYRTLVSRRTDSHKGDNGRGLIVGGSAGMIGAPILAAEACLRGGIGLLMSAVPSHIVPVMAGCLRETTFVRCEEEQRCLTEMKLPEQLDVVAIGMGLGRSAHTENLLKSVLERDVAGVIDADALFFLDSLFDIVDSRKAITVITPHMGEMARLCGLSVEQVQVGRFEVSRELATRHGIYVVLKGPYTIVTTPEGKQYVNTSGNAGLAKGGSGDVLTGLITGMLPRYENPQHAISNAVYLHGKAADQLLEQGYDIDSISPSDILRQLPFHRTCFNEDTLH